MEKASTSRNKSTISRSRQGKPLTVEETAAAIRDRRGVLTYGRSGRIVVWAPGQCIPMYLRSAVAANNRELQRLIHRSDPRVCVNPTLHRESWCYVNRRYACDTCARLLPEVS